MNDHDQIALPVLQSKLPMCPKCHKRRLSTTDLGFGGRRDACSCGYLMYWRVSIKFFHHVSITEARWLGQPNNPALVGEPANVI